MTQATSQIGADQSGLAYRNADNAGKEAILNHHMGPSAPSYAEAGMIWLNNTATPWTLNIYTGTTWITLGAVNATTNTFNPYIGAAPDRVLTYAADTGAANAYAIAPSPVTTAYATGQIATLKPVNANTGASTLNVNGLGAQNIKLFDGTNPYANALLTTGTYILVYDGTNFVLTNPSPKTTYLNYAADTGAANAYAVAPSPPITAYAAGQVVALQPVNANTGASTINVNGLGTQNIKLLDGTTPAANALLTTGNYLLMYNGTNFVLMNPSQPAFVGDSGSGGFKGLVPAPSAGAAAANLVLGAGGGWVSSTSSVTVNAQSAGYTLQASDKNCIVSLTGSTAETFAFTAPATLGSGWFCYLYNNSTAALTLTPGSSVQVDGLTSYIMYPGEVRLVQCSGTAFTTILLNGGTAIFNSSGSWTRPPGYTAFEAEILSGGGAGASRTTTGSAGGGAGGAYYRMIIPATALVAAGSTETVTVAGTAAGVSGNTAGTNGNTSTFTINGVACSVTGGSGGATLVASTVVYAANGGCPSILSGYGAFNNSFWVTNASGGATAASLPALYGSVGGDISASNVPAAGGLSHFGGGGGGGCSSTSGGTRTGGTSLFAGAGGAGGANTGGNGTNGTAPGGGGGGAVNGGTSGSGAAGRITVRGII